MYNTVSDSVYFAHILNNAVLLIGQRRYCKLNAYGMVGHVFFYINRILAFRSVL